MLGGNHDVIISIRVVYVPDLNKKSVFVVTAYELKGKTLLAYRKRRRKT
jgi:hypothetical protein